MPHIDEGVLHAYLDGALDEYPSATAEHVREHLEVCEACRDRLAAERAIRERAVSILGVARPDVAAPPLEDLRAQARARAPRRSPGSARLYRLGWAASIVVAVGAGWIMGGGPAAPAAMPDASESLAGGVRGEPAPAERGYADATAPSPGSSRPSGAGQEPATSEAERPTPTAQGERLLPSRTGAPALSVDVATVDESVVSPSSPLVLLEPDLGAPPRLQAPPLDVPERVAGARHADAAPAVSGSDTGGTLADRAGPETVRSNPLSSGEVLTSASRAGDVSGISALPGALRGNDDPPEERADTGESYSLVVPDMEVLDVRFRGDVRPEGQVVLQRLPSGDTLEVIHLPPEIGPGSLEPAGPSEREIVLKTASGWIVMRAPVDEDQLRELMSRLLSED